jgi:hypothetical protein
MLPGIDIWRAAALMIKHYGDTADIEAAAKADEFLAKSELDGERTWMRIAKVIDELRTDSHEGERPGRNAACFMR